jgi:hypothetical protein
MMLPLGAALVALSAALAAYVMVKFFGVIFLGQPIRHIFGGFFVMTRELPTPFDHAPRYRVIVGDRIWESLYTPLGMLVQRVANAFAWLQQGRISTYLLYSFVTLISLLALML